jgi:TRAP-type mannitol/chloroaromatic compound transport system permease small subunit
MAVSIDRPRGSGLTVQPILLAIDRVNGWIGKLFAWSIVLLTIAISYEVLVRYMFRAPTTWAYDVSYILYGTLFMMAGAHTLARNGHVRGDFIYRTFAPRRQAMLDLVLYFVFFFPGIIALVYSGWDFFLKSYAQNERSAFSPGGPIIWPFKFLIPLAGAMLTAQGFAEVVRCVVAIRDGDWPQRLSDVEETEKLILEQAEAAQAKAELAGASR